MNSIQVNKHKGINQYEKKELTKYLLVQFFFTTTLIVVLIAVDTNDLEFFWGIGGTYILLSFFLVKKILTTYNQAYLSFDHYALGLNGKKLIYSDLKSASALHIRIIESKRNNYSNNIWSDEYYYRCLNLNFKTKDILIGYLFEESSIGMTEIYDKTYLHKRMKGFCETYHGNEPYMYIFSEEDFNSIYSQIKKGGIKIETIRN